VLSLVKFKNAGNPDEVQKFKDDIVDNYNRQGSAYYSTSRLWDDGIIRPSDLRRVLGLSLGVSLNAPIEDVKQGVFRM
jgi:3-methylcrotonyl-CoA carboxylase beta subunit